MCFLRSGITFVSIVTLMAILGLVGFSPFASASGGNTIRRISIASDGTQSNGASLIPVISGNGRYVTFWSIANNLVDADSNNREDVFVHDLETGQTTRASISSGGAQSNASSYLPAISEDGGYVVFESLASNLVIGDTNGFKDIFVHTRSTGQTRRVSVSSFGNEGNAASNRPSISANGRYVVFESSAGNLVVGDSNEEQDIFIHDRQTGQTELVSVSSSGIQANGASYVPSISADGTYVAFWSRASNLVADDTNGVEDVFVHDRSNGQTTRISVSTGGAQGDEGSFIASISADGQYVTFRSAATNLVVNDTNGVQDVFVHNRQSSQTVRVSVTSNGVEGNGDSRAPVTSEDGRYIAFYSDASNLVADDTNEVQDVFVHDSQTRQTTRVSVSESEIEGNGHSVYPSISGNGRYIAFYSDASNLVTSDTNTVSDVFLTDTEDSPISTPTPTITTTPPPGATFTPTPPATNSDVFIPLVLGQHAYATPAPTPTLAPQPTCEVVDHEPNNVFLDADNNLPFCNGVAVTGSVAPTTDVNDIYRIEVVEQTTLQLQLSHLPAGADYDLYLYDVQRNTVATSIQAGSGNEQIQVGVGSGRYYIRVVSIQYGGNNTYRLYWSGE